MSSSLAIMPAETSGREITYSISSRQPGGRAAAVEFSQKKRAGEEPAVVLLQALFGRRGDRLELARRGAWRVAASAAFARYGLRALGEARQMGAGLAAVAQQRGGEQAAEAGRAPQRLDRAPGLVGKRGGEGRRQVARLIDDRAPFGEARVLVPVEVVDERIALADGRRRGPPFAGEGSVGLGDGRVDRGEQFRELVVLGDRRIERLVFVCRPARGLRPRAGLRPTALPCPAAPRDQRATAPSRARRRRCGGARATRRGRG